MKTAASGMDILTVVRKMDPFGSGKEVFTLKCPACNDYWVRFVDGPKVWSVTKPPNSDPGCPTCTAVTRRLDEIADA